MKTWLFPNGIGTRALIAFGVIGGTIAGCFTGVPDPILTKLIALAMIVMTFYFKDRDKMKNGNGGTAPGN